VQKLNILWLGSSYKQGLLYHFVELAKKFKQQGHNIVILTSSGEQEKGLYEQLKQNGIPFYVSDQIDKRSILSIYNASKIIRQIISAENIDVIQANGFFHLIKSYFALKLAGLKNKMPVFMYLHSIRHGSKCEMLARFIGSRLLNRFVTIAMPVSEQERNKMLRYGLMPAKAVTVYNAVDFDKFEKSTSLNNKKILPKFFKDEMATDGTIAYFANLIPRKGHKYLLWAAVEVLKVFPKTHFLFVGDGPHRRTLEGMITELKLDKNVKITGWVNNKYIPQILSGIDIAVVPSLSETFCYAIIEPMAVGKPVISTPVGIAPEIIKNGKTGLLVPHKDSQALASAITLLLKNKDKAIKMGLAGKEIVRQKFSIDIIVDKLVQNYQGEIAKMNPAKSTSVQLQNADESETVCSKR